MTLTRLLARPLLSSVFFMGGINALRNADAHAEKAKPVTDRIVPKAKKAVPQAPIPTNPKTLVQINAVAQLVSAAALATGRAPRLSATVLGASLVPTTVAGHAFWKESDPAAKKAQQLQFVKNLSVLGGLILAAVDTEGKPGVAWRAQRAARDLKREAKHVGRDAGYQARIARANVG